MTSAKKSDYILFGVGSFLIILGITLGVIWPYVCDGMSKKQLQLDKTSINYKLWLRTPIPMYLEIYLFNLTNAKEFMKNQSVIPNFEEIGPFVFKEVNDRVNLVWNNNYTVTFNQTRTWNFQPEMSVNLSTDITNVNVIATTVGYMYRTPKWVLDKLINFAMNWKETLIITKPARQWLFEGIDDGLLDLINTLKNVTNIPLPYKKFGWFVERNLSASYDGIFTMNTGVDDLYKLGMITRWNHMKQTNYFEKECAMVNGTSGEIFPPMKGLQKSISVFVPDICSTISLSYAKTTSVEGINGYQYIAGDNVFDNGTLYPENKCFCTGECIPSGARNISRCRYGAPVFVSFPHFYLADKSYSKTMTGMKPNKTEHEFILKYDPVTGIPLEVRAQLQINILLQPVSQFKLFKKVPKMYVPMMWFRQRARITPDLAQRASILHILPGAGLGVFYGLAAIGLSIIVIRLIVLLKRHNKSPDMEPIINPSTDDEDEAEEQKENENRDS